MTELRYYVLIMIFVFQIIGLFINGFALFLFRRKKSLRAHASQQLILLLTLTDWLYALLCLPHITYLIYNWRPDGSLYNPQMVTYSASPTILQFKVNLTLTIFIALERCLALLFPIWYHKNCESGFAKVALSIGILFGAIDLTFFFGYGYNTNVQGCTATGCFISTISRQFTGISNMILGILVVLLTAGYLVKLQLFQGRQAQRRSFQQINQLASVILLSSLTLSTFPSLVIGAGEIITKIAEIFRVIGPFYVAGMTLTAIPGMSYLIANWSPINVHYDPYITVYSNSPLIFEYKVNLTLTVAVALDRCWAILLPFWYHQRKGSYFSMVVLGIGLFLGLMDFLVLIEFGDIHDVPGCTAAGCFVSSFARKCMGYSNMANRVACAILLTSLSFCTVPSFLIGAGEIFTKLLIIFATIGPFYITGLVLTGIANGIIFLTLNSDALQVVGKVLSMNLGENTSNQNTAHSIPRPLEQENSKSSVKKKTSVNNVKLVWTAS
ncbi:unnamed protein product [Caenorhabditis auriculariae]|uniref:G-protein coupled receptors family 1 profile domain-containing protein n=1 Tax=Caenorhabditis auriculariae TaxID=2777116 RepID=A0A8S1H8U0_9PELO|nr:unnamed protein product [Caenorhabditis auriculariae]